MKWNRVIISKLAVTTVGAVLLVFSCLSSGCSRPSRIQVTGVKRVQVSDDSDREESVNMDSSAQTGAGDPDAGQTDSGVTDAGQTGTGDADAGLRDTGKADAGQASAADAASVQDSGAAQIAVYVCGAVMEPGVYYFQEGARICDAIDAAGGFLVMADSQWLNQARILSDGEMLVVYTQEETAALREQGIAQGSTVNPDPASAAPGQASGSEASPASGGDGSGSEVLVNLNTASREELMTLPGIGEAKADAIIRYRTEVGLFASTEDVMNISGIKTSVYGKIRDHITV